MTGGTFCRFSVGRPDQSARYLRYVARAGAVREEGAGVAHQNIHPELLKSSSYAAFVARLCDYARIQAHEEVARHHSRGTARTHYRATLSFESDPGTVAAKDALRSWLLETFPLARAAAFLHRNTLHLHAHVWIEARQVNGLKINLSARAYRQLDEGWNRVYAPLFGRSDADHLHKKWQTEGYKQMRRSGDAVPLPRRAAHDFHPALFTERERTRLGKELYERHERGNGSDQHTAASSDYQPEASQRGAWHTEPTALRIGRIANAANRADDRAVSETDALYQAASSLDRGTVAREVEDRERSCGDSSRR